MLSTQQKAQILKNAGHAVPPTPSGAAPSLETWNREVENLYVSYVAARAARSLREAEEVRQLELLRQLASPASFA